MSKFFKFLKYLSLSVYAVCGVALLVFAVPRTGWKALTVATGSMRPAIPPGSLVVVHRVPNSALKVGDVITFINPRNAKQTITHRIVETKSTSGLPAFVTKGDANETRDGEILGGNVVGRVIWHAPYVGRVVNWTKTPLGLILLLGIPALLIIIDEIRLLIKAFTKTEGTAPAAADESPAPSSVVAPSVTPATVPVAKPAPARPRRGMDGIIGRVLVLGLLGSVVVRVTQAQLVTNPVTLTGNTIKTFVAANHIVISRALIGDSDLVCPVPTNTVNISNTGPFSQNQAIAISHCSVTSTTNNNVTVTNNNNQNANTGPSNVSDNTNGSSASSGDANNLNSTTTNININNGSHAPVQWVELHNPTDTSLNLIGWSLSDNSPAPRIIAPPAVIPAHGYLLVSGTIGDGLSGTGDRLILRNTAQAVVDAISWGSDTSQLNPAISAIAAGTGIHRLAPGLDTDSASDWTGGF